MPEGNQEGRARAVEASAWLLEHAQDLVSVGVGMVLIVLAGAELVSGIIDFFTDLKKASFDTAGINLLNRVLLVLILVEMQEFGVAVRGSVRLLNTLGEPHGREPRAGVVHLGQGVTDPPSGARECRKAHVTSIVPNTRSGQWQ